MCCPAPPTAWALPYFHLVQLVHGFRMPVFFLLSGFFCALLWQRRGLRGLLKNRILRIALPLIICIPTIRSMEYVLNPARLGLRCNKRRVGGSHGQGPQQSMVPLAVAVCSAASC